MLLLVCVQANTRAAGWRPAAPKTTSLQAPLPPPPPPAGHSPCRLANSTSVCAQQLLK
jgi:hypothetical protein